MQAESSFKTALALDPDFYEARFELAQTYRFQAMLGEITLATADESIMPLLERLLEERPDNGLALMVAGFHESRRSDRQGDVTFDVEKHLAELTTAIEQTPNEPRLYRAMARHLWSSKRRQEALEYLDRGIAVDPLDSRMHLQRGQRLYRLGDLDGAEASFARVMELNPESPGGYQWAAIVHWDRKQYVEFFALFRKAMDLDNLDNEMPAAIALNLYTFGLMDEGDRYLQRAIAFAPDKVYIRRMKLYRRFLADDYLQSRDMSESMLRDDVEDRFAAYGFAAMVFVSTMSDLDRIDEALAVLEELRPGSSAPDFHPRGSKDQALQYHTVLALAKAQSNEETLRMLDTVVPRWDESFPEWREDPGAVAAIEMARGNTELAIELTLENLDGRAGLDLPNGWPYLLYRHIDYYRPLALHPAVAERLTELDAEAKQAGENVWAYIEEHQLQL